VGQDSLQQLLRLLKLQQREVNVGERAPIGRERRGNVRRAELGGRIRQDSGLDSRRF
jgi:hypothetical protein